MNEKIKRDIIDVLTKFVPLLQSKDYLGMRELSNHTIHNSSIYQDPDSNQVAVVTYALSKVVEHSTDVDSNKFSTVFLLAADSLKKNDQKKFRDLMKQSIKMIAECDSFLQNHIREVLEQAKIKKGGKLYDHGVSLSRAAQVLGISQWDLMDYVGKTKIIDNIDLDSDVKKRLNVARELFK